MRTRAVGLFGAVSSFPKVASRGNQAGGLAVPHAGLVGESEL